MFFCSQQEYEINVYWIIELLNYWSFFYAVYNNHGWRNLHAQTVLSAMSITYLSYWSYLCPYPYSYIPRLHVVHTGKYTRMSTISFLTVRELQTILMFFCCWFSNDHHYQLVNAQLWVGFVTGPIRDHRCLLRQAFIIVHEWIDRWLIIPHGDSIKALCVRLLKLLETSNIILVIKWVDNVIQFGHSEFADCIYKLGGKSWFAVELTKHQFE